MYQYSELMHDQPKVQHTFCNDETKISSQVNNGLIKLTDIDNIQLK